MLRRRMLVKVNAVLQQEPIEVSAGNALDANTDE